MDTKFRTHAQAKRLVSWAALMQAVQASRDTFWFENSDSVWHQALYIGKPATSPGPEPRTYWVERNATGETSFAYFIYVFDGERVERITDWKHPHQFADNALRSAFSLAGQA